jgi:hypothetical protein
MKTIDLRVLVPDDVDEEFFVEQLVQMARGAGAPRGAVRVDLVGEYDDVADVEPVGRVVVHVDYQYWNGERVTPGVPVVATATRVEPDDAHVSQVRQLKQIAREPYPPL